jgi:hypothetical protein
MLVLWMKADSPEAMDASLSAFASLLGLPEANERDQTIQIKALLGWLHGHERWLLIADNADTELAALAIRDRFPPRLRGAILVTSRLSAWPLNMPHFQLDFLTPADATRFLLDRVTKEGHNAGEEAAALSLAQELGYLPIALEQASAFIIEVHWSFDKYREQLREARPELLGYVVEGGTHYPASVAKTWSITLERLSPLSRFLLRQAVWFAPDLVPRGLFLSEALMAKISKKTFGGAFSWVSYLQKLFWPLDKALFSDFAVDKALAELDRFSLIRLTRKTASMHRLLQAVEQDALSPDERGRELTRAARLFNAFAPERPDDTHSWDVWLPLLPHAEMLLEWGGSDIADSVSCS